MYIYKNLVGIHTLRNGLSLMEIIYAVGFMIQCGKRVLEKKTVLSQFFLKSVGHQAHCPMWNSSKRNIEEKFLVYYISLKKSIFSSIISSSSRDNRHGSVYIGSRLKIAFRFTFGDLQAEANRVRI